MSRTPAEVTDAELAVLQALWDHGSATIRQLTQRLYPDDSASCYATVQKLLERLEAKACVIRDRAGPTHSFTPAVCRDELIGRRLRTVAEKLCGGSLTPLLTHLVRAENLSASERAQLRDLIDELEKQGNKRGPKRKNA